MTEASKDKRHPSVIILILLSIVVAAIVLISIFEREGGLNAAQQIVDDCESFRAEHFLSISSVTGGEMAAPIAEDGRLALLNNDGRVPILIMQPLTLSPGASLKRSAVIETSGGYAGYLKVFWLNGPNDDDPTVLAMVEYDGENNTIRLLTGDMDNPDVAMSTELIQNQLFEEQIEYNGDTGVFSYSLNGEQTQTQIVQKQEGYLMVVMQTVSGEAGGTFYLDELEAQSKGNN